MITSYDILTSPRDEKLECALSTILKDHDVTWSNNHSPIEFERSHSSGYALKKTDTAWKVTYEETKDALRAFSSMLSNIEQEQGHSPFTKFGIMLDCSRNGVMKPSVLKRWLRQLALLGYNQVMLYTEDTYQLEGEPYFGYLRGGYSLADVKELDAYAVKLGIELVACIQTLGHLSQVLKWKAYSAIKDTERVLMIDDDQSYALIEKMIGFWREGLSSDRIHIGMDETHDLGRGSFMDKFGYEDGFDLFNRHLSKVMELCQKVNYQPMIWSDMYFRLGSQTQDYYDKNLVIPERAKEAIPKDVELVYWDYYSKDQSFYSEWIQRHRDLGKEPIMASGAWTWSKFWYDHQKTVSTAGPCIKACRQEGVKEFMLTMWGDDGAYCDFDSAFAGLTWAAEEAYHEQVDESHLRSRFKTLFEDDYDSNLAISSMYNEHFPAQTLLWDDPILNIMTKDLLDRRENNLVDAIAHFSAVKGESSNSPSFGWAGDHDHGREVISTLLAKIECSELLLTVSAEKNWKAFSEEPSLVKNKIHEVIRSLESLTKSFRKRWSATFRPNGLEVLQIRLAGLISRYKEILMRIEEMNPRDDQQNEELFQDLLERISTIDGPLPYPHYIYVASSSLCISRPV